MTGAPAKTELAFAVLEPKDFIECPDCGWLQQKPTPIARYTRRCCRCRASFGSGLIQGDAALAFSLASVVLFVAANLFPFIAIDVAGRGQSVRLASGVAGLADHGLVPLAVFVLAISFVAPLGRVGALCYVLLRVRGTQRPPHLATMLRWSDRLRPWAMLDVFLVGTLVALTKLHDLATVDIGIGLWSLALLVLAFAAVDLTLDRGATWDLISPPLPVPPQPVPEHWIGCRTCGLVQSLAPNCARCWQSLHRRKPASQIRTTALVLTGLILYVPANLYPVVTVVSFGHRASATILGGVIELLNGSDWPLAVIVFTASVAVPLLKLVGLAWLALSTQLRSRRRLADRTRLYRLIELVSRWSAVDIFVAGLLTALVTLGNLATIEPGVGVLAFGAVVFVTMLATDCFDTRLMWDAAGASDG